MRILVTGGTGFLGKAAARAFLRAGHEVAVLGRNSAVGKALAKEGIRFFQADLADKAKTAHAIQGQEVILHSGALASPWGKYETFYQANVVGTQNVVEAALQNHVRRLINISTPSLYFDGRHRLNIRESEPLPPKQLTHYGATKWLADQEVARGAAKGLETISIRPRAIFGPEDQTVLGRVIRTAEKGTAPLINGGKSFVDMTYIDNVVDALFLCLNAPREHLGKTYNITNGEPIPARAMWEMLLPRLGMKVRYQNVPYRAAYALASLLELGYRVVGKKDEPPLTRYAVGLMAKSQTLDISRARADLGYSPKVSLAEGFDRFASWWKDAGSQKPLN